MLSKWDILISKFNLNNGIIENLYQKKEDFYRGLFPINSNINSKIFVPTKLLIKIEDIFLKNNTVRIKDSLKYSNEIRDFFDFYQDNFSWGGGGYEAVDLFEKGLKDFPSSLKTFLKEHGIIDIESRHKGDWDNVIFNGFLKSRNVIYRGQLVIAPIWELVNHNVNSPPFLYLADGLSTPTQVPSDSEVTFSYGSINSLKRFFDYGFFSKELKVYSIPFTKYFKELNKTLSCKGKNLNDDLMTIRKVKNTLTIEGLPISDRNFSDLPLAYWNELTRRISSNELSKNTFLEILIFNLKKRKDILEYLIPVNNYSSELFKNVIDYEIRLIENSINCV